MPRDALSAAIEFSRTALDKVWPEASETERQKVQMVLTMFAAQAQIVANEAASSHWLSSNWRPIVMLVFCGLIVARWFGLADPNLSEAEYIKLWDIVQLSLGGYVVGRTVEKVAPRISRGIRNF